MLTDGALEYINRSVLCWLATADAEGLPNVSPKEVFATFGRDYLVIVNIASPRSIRNIKVNSKVCVSYIDVFVQKGFKVQGTAEVVMPTDARYRDLEGPLLAITRGAFHIHSIIAVCVAALEPIIAPSYHLKSGTTEATQVAAAMQTYGVLPNTAPI